MQSSRHSAPSKTFAVWSTPPESRNRNRARFRDQRLTRSSLGEGASGLVLYPPRRHDQIRRRTRQRGTKTSIHSTSQCPTGEDLWHEMRRVILFWIDQGVTAFRVDNPHTKPTALLGMAHCGRAGDPPGSDLPFRSIHSAEVDEVAGESRVHPVLHVLHLAQLQAGDHRLLHRTDPHRQCPTIMRGNLFTNTHDILPYFLQESGRPASRSAPPLPRRSPASTASTAVSSFARQPLFPAKRSISTRKNTSTKSGTGTGQATSVQISRNSTASAREHPALHEYDNLRFYWSDDDNILVYGKQTPDQSDNVLVVVNLDPFQTARNDDPFPARRLRHAARRTIRGARSRSAASAISGTGEANTSGWIQPVESAPTSFICGVGQHLDYVELDA